MATHRTADGVRLSAAVTGWKQAAEFWFLLIFMVGMILLIAAVATHPARRIEGIVSIVVASGVLVEIGRRYFTQRRLRSATLVIAAWPLRLGQRVKVRFEKRLKVRAVVDGFHARLTCTEEAIVSAGKYREIKRGTLYDVALDTSRAIVQRGRICDEWEMQIPVEGIPSFSVKSNKIEWRVETITDTEGVGVAADFTLQVIPELSRSANR